MYVEYIVAVVDLNMRTRTKQISGMHVTQISARFELVVHLQKFMKQGWVFMDPAKPYEPHLRINCS